MAATMGKFHLFPNGTTRGGLSYFAKIKAAPRILEPIAPVCSSCFITLAPLALPRGV